MVKTVKDNKDKDKDKLKDKGNDKEKDKDKAKEKDKAKDKEKEKEKGKDKGKEKAKEKEVDAPSTQEKKKDKDEVKDKNAAKDKDKDEVKENNAAKEKDKELTKSVVQDLEASPPPGEQSSGAPDRKRRGLVINLDLDGPPKASESVINLASKGKKKKGPVLDIASSPSRSRSKKKRSRSGSRKRRKRRKSSSSSSSSPGMGFLPIPMSTPRDGGPAFDMITGGGRTPMMSGAPLMDAPPDGVPNKMDARQTLGLSVAFGAGDGRCFDFSRGQCHRENCRFQH